MKVHSLTLVNFLGTSALALARKYHNKGIIVRSVTKVSSKYLITLRNKIVVVAVIKHVFYSKTSFVPQSKMNFIRNPLN